MRCINCNQEIPEGKTICDFCGIPVIDQMQQPPYQQAAPAQMYAPPYGQPQVQNKNKIAILPICLTIALVIALCVIVFLLVDMNKYKAKASRYDRVEEVFDVDLERELDRYEERNLDASYSVESHNAAISEIVGEIDAYYNAH